MLGRHSFYVLGIGSTLIDPLMLVALVDFYFLIIISNLDIKSLGKDKIS